MQQISFLILAVFLNLTIAASPKTDSSFVEIPVTLHTATGDLFGTLTIPKSNAALPLALIIAGSGPTDRNGNNSMMKNDGLKQLAYTLADDTIASLRFDKRGIAASAAAGKKEGDLRFEDYVADVTGWILLLRKDSRFSKIIIIGHSEGSLIGMMAAKHADQFISIAGAGQSADVILKEQLSTQPDQVKDISFVILDSLKAGKTVDAVDPMFNALFRKSVQPYLISWFKYDPQEEIKKLSIPVLILQGTNDIQVKEEDANRLAKANPAAKLVLIENMNHVLKTVAGGRDVNIKSYNDPSLPVAPALVKAIADFIKTK